MENRRRKVAEFEQFSAELQNENITSDDLDLLRESGITEKIADIVVVKNCTKDGVITEIKFFVKLIKGLSSCDIKSLKEEIEKNFPHNINGARDYKQFGEFVDKITKEMKLSSKAKEENTTQKNISNKLSNATEETITVGDLEHKSKCCILI